jgi:hypothetical protein
VQIVCFYIDPYKRSLTRTSNLKMSIEQLAELTQPQRDRRVRGVARALHRGDPPPGLGRTLWHPVRRSRDLALYKELAPGNIDYDSKAKTYVLGPDFRAVFDFPLSGCCPG